MKDAVTIIGIDVAAVRPSTAVAVRTGRTGQAIEWMEADHRQPDQVAALMAWIERHAPTVVAIDAPQDYKRPARRAAVQSSGPAPGRSPQPAGGRNPKPTSARTPGSSRA